MNFINNIKSAYVDNNDNADRGDIVQTILIIAGFALVCIMAINWIGTAILNKGADTAACIQGSNTFNSGTTNTNCQAGDAAAKANPYQNDAGYKSHYNK